MIYKLTIKYKNNEVDIDTIEIEEAVKNDLMYPVATANTEYIKTIEGINNTCLIVNFSTVQSIKIVPAYTTERIIEEVLDKLKILILDDAEKDAPKVYKDNKVSLIKEIKNKYELGLKEAKDIVEDKKIQNYIYR